jgi:hypothetical protein
MESCCEGEEEEEADDDGDDMSQNSNSSKRQRRDSGGGSSTGSSTDINKVYSTSIPMDLWTAHVNSETNVGVTVDTRDRMASSGGHGTPLPLPGDSDKDSDTATRRTAALNPNMVTTSIAERAPSGATKKETYEYSDWEEIKEMLSWASELCDRAWLLLYARLIAARINPI